MKWTDYQLTPQTLWEQGLPAMAKAHSTPPQPDPPLSRASFAPTEESGPNTFFCPLKFQCGSEPARDGGGSAALRLTDTPLSRASFAPTEESGPNTFFCPLKFQCGSEPARDGGGSAALRLTDTAPSRARSLPPGVGGAQSLSGNKKPRSFRCGVLGVKLSA